MIKIYKSNGKKLTYKYSPLEEKVKQHITQNIHRHMQCEKLMTPCWKWKRKHKKYDDFDFCLEWSFFSTCRTFLLFWNLSLFLDGFDNLKLRCINQLDLQLVIEGDVFSCVFMFNFI